MAKTTAPLLSFGASGQIAKTAVYSKWRGRPYVRRHAIPANPQSAAQTEVRSLFAWLNGVWKNMGSLGIAPWNAFATGQVLVGRNAFIGKNVTILQGLTVNTAMQFSPGAKGGLAPTSISAAGGVGDITVTFTNPTAPTGWTLAAAIAIAISNDDPQTTLLFATTEGEDVSAPQDTVVLGSLAADVYTVGGWLRWTKPDGTTAYGPSVNDQATVT